MKKRALSLLLTLCMLLTILPTSALAAAAAEQPGVVVYTAEEIEQLLDHTDTPEGMENGMFSFPAAAYAIRRTETGFEIPLLRYGSCAEEAEVVLTARDINATYGADYLLEIDGTALSAEAGAMQLIATEDKNSAGEILLTEENLEEPEEPAPTEEPMPTQTPATPEAEEADFLTGTPPQRASLQAIKEALFGRELSQTDRFYGSSGETDRAAAAPSALSAELEALESVRATLRFEAGEQYKILTVRLLPGGTSAGDESFQLTLSAVTEGTGLGGYPSAAVALKHEGELEQSVVGFAQTEISAQGGTAEVTVVREQGKYNAAVVSLTTSAGTLEPGSGYSPVSETLLFLPGETEKRVSVPVTGAEGGTFSCLLDDPRGASLSASEVTITVPEAVQAFASGADNPLKEYWSFDTFQRNLNLDSNQFIRQDGGAYILENAFGTHWYDRTSYAIAKNIRQISGVAYKNVIIHYDSYGEFDSAWDRLSYNWNDREANTLTTCLWSPEATLRYIDTGWNAPVNSEIRSDVIFSRWQHSGDDSRHLTGLSQTVSIPDSGYNGMYTLTVQQQHIHPWLARGAIHVTGVELDRRQLRFEFLPHEPFYRRLGSLSNAERVDNIFALRATGGRGAGTLYVTGDVVAYSAEAAARDPLYSYMTAVGRRGMSDSIAGNTGAASALTLGGNSGFQLSDSFFATYGSAFVQDSHGSSMKKAYIVPAYNKEAWRTNIELAQAADGTAQLGFIDQNGQIVSLQTAPAYLSEEIVLRATPQPGIYVKGYRMEYQDYDGTTRYATTELNERELTNWQGRQRDIRIPVKYSVMKITPIYTSLPARKITVEVDPDSRAYGLEFPEGTLEALYDGGGHRIGELELGQQVFLFATAESGYVPVWTRTIGGQTVTYSGESYDFEIGGNDVNVRITLSFQKAGAVSCGIVGRLTQPEVTINSLLATHFGADAPRVPLAGATAATGKISVQTGTDGAFLLPAAQGGNTLRSIAGTRRTVRLVRGGESFIREVTVPSSGTADLGTVDLPLPSGLPYEVSGYLNYIKTDAQGNLNTYTSLFGGTGQDSSNLFRYDTTPDQVYGSIRWMGAGNSTYTSCRLSFTNREGVEVSRIDAKPDGSGDFSFQFNPVADTRAGGGVFLTLTDRDGRSYGPYDTGIQVSDPPSGDIELMEGPSVKIPMQDINLPIVKMAKPNFSAGLFQGSFDSAGMSITVGFDVKKLYDAAKKNTKKDNKSAADAISQEAKKQDAASSKPNAQGTTGQVTANVKDISFACTLSFAYFDASGKPLAKQEPDAVLAIYNAMFYIGGSGGASVEISSSIYGVPVYVEISGTASVAIIVSLSAVDESGKRSHFPLDAFNESPTSLQAEGLVPVRLELGLEAGVGIKKVIAIYLGGDMDFDFKWFPWETGTGTVTFGAGGGLYIFGQKLGVDYKFDPIPMFDTTQSVRTLDDSEQIPVKEAVLSSQTPNFGFDFSAVDKGNSQAQEVTLLEGVLHDTHPRIADIGNGSTMLVFLADAPAADGLNRTALYYSILEGNTASEPILIDTDGTLDASPDIRDLGDKVLIVWADARQSDFGETEDVRDIMASMDICGVFYDKRTGTLGEEFSITSDSQEEADTFYLPADSQPAICYDEASGNVGVYFIKEEFGQLDTSGGERVEDFMNGQTTAAFCPIDVEAEMVSPDYLPDEGVPEPFRAVLGGQRLLDVGLDTLNSGLSDPKIEAFAVGSAGGYTVFAYPVDLDQMGETTEDQMLFAILIDQSTGKRYAPICLTDTPSALGAPRFVSGEIEVEGEPYRTNQLVWQSGGRLLCCDMDGLLENVSFDGGICTLAEGFTPVEYASQPTETFTIGNDSLTAVAPDGGIYTVTTRQDGRNSEVFVQYYDGVYRRESSTGEAGSVSYVSSQGQWSTPVQVTLAAREDARQHILLKDAAAAQDGSLLLLCDVFNGGADTGDLRLLRIGPSPALESELAVSLNRDYPRPGDLVQVSTALKSTGLLDSEDVTVSFALEYADGTQTPIGDWTGTVPAGGQMSASTAWTVPEGLTADCRIVASAGMAEGELAFPVGEAVALEDVSYRYLSDGETQSELVVSAALLNQGNVTPAGLTLQICSVDSDAFAQGIGDENADPETAYTELARLPLTTPFAGGDISAKECKVTLPRSDDGQPGELLVRVLQANGEPFDMATEFVAVLPRVENAPFVPQNVPDSGGNSNGGSDTTNKDPDGSVTMTVTTPDGTVVETTKRKDGSQTVVETRKDGSVKQTVTTADGLKAESEITSQGKYTAHITIPDNAVKDDKTPVVLPILPVRTELNSDTAPVITITAPKGKSVDVEVPVTGVTPGTVAVRVLPDGTEQIVKTCVPTKQGLVLAVSGETTLKIMDNTKAFADVAANHWAADSINFVTARELFNGTGDAAFAPDAPMTRAMLMTVLARMDGQNTAAPEGEKWYDMGMRWAVEQGISDGTNPDGSITREQLSTMLYRYAGSPAATGTLDGFTDATTASGYATDALKWAVAQGIVTGKGSDILDPGGNATRAQVAAMLMRYLQN